MPDHEIRAAGGSPLLAAWTLPEGEQPVWEPPVVTDKHPQMQVEHYIDGKLVAVGVWPNLEPVKKKRGRK